MHLRDTTTARGALSGIHLISSAEIPVLRSRMTSPNTAFAASAAAAELPLREEMIFIAGGSFQMGSDNHYPEEAPAHAVEVDGFWIDPMPVTNRAFAAFVEETGYVSTAEIAPDPKQYPGALPEMCKPASMVFVAPQRPIDPSNWSQWWVFRFGADWRHPEGPESSLEGLMDHPVVHVSYADAVAFAVWAGKSLPSEAEWEFAARGGLDGAEFAWGSEFIPGGRHAANTWQGQFPWRNECADGFARTSPVGSFPPNGYGLYDMIGNVWEWTDDWYRTDHVAAKGTCCAVPKNPRGGLAAASHDPRDPIRIPRKVLKGGSHLCAPNYCRRYRPAARHPQPIDTSASHIGFRCVRRIDAQLKPASTARTVTPVASES
jgi:formylglycine-generating enzyme required for sulfatase activity